MPVVVSCGAFNSTGWFLQRYGSGWRWHLDGISCDGGRPVVGRWVHLVGTSNGREAALYQDGRPVATVACTPNPRRWSGPLVIGQYSSQAASFQVLGRVGDVRLYHRALRPAEVTAAFEAGGGR
jgi:hypothetical protein